MSVWYSSPISPNKIHDTHRFGSFVVVDRNEWIKDWVRPWTKKLYLYLLPHPLPPIRLVVVAVFQEREFQKLVFATVVVFVRL